MRRSLAAALVTGLIALSVTVWAGGFGPPARVAWTYEGTGALRGGPVTGDGRVNMGTGLACRCGLEGDPRCNGPG